VRRGLIVGFVVGLSMVFFWGAARFLAVNLPVSDTINYPWSSFEDYRFNLIGDDAISSATVVYTTDE